MTAAHLAASDQGADAARWRPRRQASQHGVAALGIKAEPVDDSLIGVEAK